MTLGRLFADAAAQLAAHAEPRDARLDARVLAAHVWDCTSAWLLAHDRDPAAPDLAARYLELIARRAAGEPIAYLVGHREFFGRSFRVAPGVLIPRPETELLVEAALAHLPPTATPRVLDLGTGSGCVAVTLKLERPCIDLTAVDISPVALAIARANAAELGANLHFIQSDWFVALAGQRFDLIVSNPPYIAAADPHLTQGDLRFEPYGALASGDDGLDAPRRLIATAPAHLVPQGWLWLEHGYNQGEAVAGLLHEHGFSAIETRQDLAGHDRLSGGRMA